MKKTLLSILLGVSILTLAGCGNKETNTTGAPAQDVIGNVVAEEVVGEIQNSGVQPTEQETVVEEETIGVPQGEVPEYAKNWTEADYGEFTDETAIVKATPGNWTTGIFTYDGKEVDLSKTFAELKAAGFEFVDYDRPAEDTSYFEQILCGIGTVDLTTLNYDTPIKSDEAVFNEASANAMVGLEGIDFCGIIWGDDFGKYKDTLGKPYFTNIQEDFQEYSYVSDSGYRLDITVEDYNIVSVTLSRVQE